MPDIFRARTAHDDPFGPVEISVRSPNQREHRSLIYVTELSLETDEVGDQITMTVDQAEQLYKLLPSAIAKARED